MKNHLKLEDWIIDIICNGHVTNLKTAIYNKLIMSDLTTLLYVTTY